MPTIRKNPALGEPAASDILPDQSGLNLYGDRRFHPQEPGEGQKEQKNNKNKQLQKKKERIHIFDLCYGWTTGARNIEATKWYRQTGTNPSAWAPLVHIALFGWFDFLLTAAAAFNSPSIWASFPSSGHQVAVLFPLLPNCPAPPSHFPSYHLTSILSSFFRSVFQLSLCLLQVLCFLPVAYTSWLLVLKCVEMVDVLLPMNLFLAHLPDCYPLISSSIRRREKRWRVSSCFWCFLVYSSPADELLPLIWHPSLCQVTLVAIWALVIHHNYLMMWWFFFLFFFFGLDWNAKPGLNLWACRMATC